MYTLPIKGKWFDMIASGEKKEEYRRYCPYWAKRLGKTVLGKRFHIRFRNGYRSDSPLMECLVYMKHDPFGGMEEWGAVPGRRYYILVIESVEVLIQRKGK